MLTRWWPGSLAGQLVVIVLVALIAGQSLSALIFADERRVALRAANREQVLARTAGLVRLLEETPGNLHQRILAASSGAFVRFSLAPRSEVAVAEPWHARNRVARQLTSLLDGNGGRAVLADFGEERRITRLIGFAPLDEATGGPGHWRRSRPRTALQLAVLLADGRWINAETLAAGPAPGWALPSLVSLALSAVKLYPPPQCVLISCGWRGSASIFLRSRLTWLSMLRSNIAASRPRVRSRS